MSEETTAIFIPPSEHELPADRFLERELSWLDFNQRVLELAEDENLPLLERVNYLSIFASNLDEFFMVRVASLKRRIATGIAVPSPSGLSPQEVLQQIADRTRELQSRHAELFAGKISKQLAEHDIQVVHWSTLTAEEREELHAYFSSQVFPVLTPLAVDPAHPRIASITVRPSSTSIVDSSPSRLTTVSFGIVCAFLLRWAFPGGGPR